MPLWKRCRILASSLRLEMLLYLGENEPQCVKSVAGRVGVSEAVSCKNLQILESGSFLEHKRVGKYLFYSLNQSDELLRMVSGVICSGRPDFSQTIHILTALTHERRVLIVSALAKGELEFGQLCRRTGISRQAMVRQLDKLVRRGFVFVDNGYCGLLVPESRMGNDLMGLVV